MFSHTELILGVEGMKPRFLLLLGIGKERWKG